MGTITISPGDKNYSYNIYDRICGIDEETRGDLILELGMDYAMKYGYDVATHVWKQKLFWNWFRRIWEINENRIISDLNKRNLDTVDISYYEKWHRLLMVKYRMTDKIREKVFSEFKTTTICQQ